MNDAWKQDPRLASMNPEKLEFLTDFAKQLGSAPKDQSLARFISWSTEAQNRGITFSDQEAKLLTDILISHLSSAEKGRFDLFRTLSQKMTSRRG